MKKDKKYSLPTGFLILSLFLLTCVLFTCFLPICFLACSSENSSQQIRVKGGSYTLGDNIRHARYDAEVGDFFIDKTEVTNRQFADVYNWALDNGLLYIAPYNGDSEDSATTTFFQSGCRVIDTDRLICLREDYPWPMFEEWKESCRVKYRPDKGNFIVEEGWEEYPMVEVCWYGAAAYCNFLSLKEGLTPVYETEFWDRDKEADGYRLPTNEEWEWAARGGVKSKNFPFSGSEKAEEAAWFSENSEQEIHPVGQKNPNELGLYDMSGNVWEFCTEKEGKFKGILGAGIFLSFRLWRGGSYNTKDINIHIFRQHIDYPGYNYGYSDVGFRTVRRK